MIDWDLWHSASELAQTGSYKAAGRRLGVNPTTIKRRQEILEHKLGRHLFLKKAGQIVPTPACKLALEDIEAAAKHIQAARLGLGHDLDHRQWRKITITSVPYICDRLLSPAVGRLPVHRRVRVELVGQDRNLDVSEGRDADIALRLGPATSESVTSRHIADIHYSTYAMRPTDADKTPWVTLDRSYSHLEEVRLPEKHVSTEGVRFTAGNMVSQVAVIATGVAKGLVPDFIAHQQPDLAVLKAHPTLTRPLWLIWRNDGFDNPHFKSVLTWITCEAVNSLKPTRSADDLLRLLQS